MNTHECTARPARRPRRRRRGLARTVAAAVLTLGATGVPASAAELSPAEHRATPLPQVAYDVVYDAARDLVYASVPSTSPSHPDHVVALDPFTGTVLRSVSIPGDPGPLALADDQSTLYVGLLSGREVVRIDVTDLTVVQTTDVPHPEPGPLYVEDLEIRPGDPDVVVVSLAMKGISPRHAGVVAIDDGSVLPVRVEGRDGPNSLTAGPDANTFYGYDGDDSGFEVYTLRLEPDGVRIVDEARGLLGGFDQQIEYRDGLLYSSYGLVADPTAEVARGRYGVVGAIEPVGDRTYIWRADGLHTFDRSGFSRIAVLGFETVGVRRSGSLVATRAGLVGANGAGQLYLFTRRPPTFTDTAADTHRHAITAVAGAGVAAGYPDGRFKPGEPVTRGQMATFLRRALHLPEGSGSSFADTTGHPHAASIAAVAAAGIAAGFGDGTFRPDDRVTRAQMASFLVRGFDLPAAAGANPFTDVAGTHAGSVAALHDAGITGGTSRGQFSPSVAVTRGQMATFLARALGLVDRLPGTAS